MRKLIVLLSLAVSVPAMADVFQWKDESGHLQMSDHPPPDSSHVKVLKKNLQEAPVSAESSKEAAEVRKRQDAALTNLQSKQADAQKEKKTEAETATAEAATCSQLKTQQAALNSGGRVITFDSNGQRQYAGTDEIQQKRQDITQGLQDNHCE